MVLLKPDGKGGYEKGERVSLGERDRESGRYYRNIVRSIPASVVGLQPARLLV